MATMKRHIIYLSDEEWERLRAAAAKDGITISDLIRRAVAQPKRGK